MVLYFPPETHLSLKDNPLPELSLTKHKEAPNPTLKNENFVFTARWKLSIMEDTVRRVASSNGKTQGAADMDDLANGMSNMSTEEG